LYPKPGDVLKQAYSRPGWAGLWATWSS